MTSGPASWYVPLSVLRCVNLTLRQFLLFVAGYIAVAAISITGYRTTGAAGRGIYASNTFSLNSNTLALFGCVLAVALAFSWLYLLLARLLPKQLIWISGILNLAVAFGTAIFYLYKRYWSAGIVFLVLACFMAFAFYTWIPRIPFSALMLKTSVNTANRFGHVYLVSLVGGLVGIALSGLFSVTLVSIYVRFEPSNSNPNCANGSCSKARLIGLLVYTVFVNFWISEWLKNTLHCTVAGVFGSWYFCVHNFPRRATRGALKRALTYSFGSISLGSLLVAIVQLLRQLCSIARQQAADDGGIGGMVLYVVFCLLQCLVGLLEWALEFLNRYAFVNCALYNKPYFSAASDTWKMIKDRGIDALVNVSLLSSSDAPPSPLLISVSGVPHWPRLFLRRSFRRLLLCHPCIRFPPHHQSTIQLQRRLHPGRRCLCVPDWLPACSNSHDPAVKRHRHHLRGGRMGPAGHDPGPPRAIRRDGARLPAGAAGHSGALRKREPFRCGEPRPQRLYFSLYSSYHPF